MRLIVAPDRASAAKLTADIIERFVKSTAPAVLGIATGATMEEPLAEVVRRHRRGAFSLARTEIYLLDEYIGLEPGGRDTFRSAVDRRFVSRTDVPAAAVHSPDPHATDLGAECDRYEQEVRGAQIGLQLLGIGTNGHIAFNEPGSALDGTTRVVELSEQTRTDNARFFAGRTEPPTTAITQGIATILAARELLLVACGPSKACALARAIEGPVTEMIPASALQLHPNATVIADPSAASELASASAVHESPFDVPMTSGVENQ